MTQPTTTLPRSPFPIATADALAHLISSHGWAPETSPADTALVGAHRFAHGIDGRPDLADSDLDHAHGPALPVQPTAPYPYPYAQRRTSGLAIASMVLGICWIWWIGSILALVFGIVALRQIEESNGTQAGRGMAIAGSVLGGVGLVSLGLMVLLMMVGAASSSSGY